MFCLVWETCRRRLCLPTGRPRIGYDLGWEEEHGPPGFLSSTFFEIDYETKNKTPLTSSESVGLPKGKLMQYPGWHQMVPRGHGVHSTQMGECSWGPYSQLSLLCHADPCYREEVEQWHAYTRTSLGMSHASAWPQTQRVELSGLCSQVRTGTHDGVVFEQRQCFVNPSPSKALMRLRDKNLVCPQALP